MILWIRWILRLNFYFYPYVFWYRFGFGNFELCAHIIISPAHSIGSVFMWIVTFNYTHTGEWCSISVTENSGSATQYLVGLQRQQQYRETVKATTIAPYHTGIMHFLVWHFQWIVWTLNASKQQIWMQSFWCDESIERNVKLCEWVNSFQFVRVTSKNMNKKNELYILNK